MLQLDKSILNNIWISTDNKDSTSLYECLYNYYGSNSISDKNLKNVWPKFTNELHVGFDLLIQHITEKNRIIVLGDYDVDGIAGSVIMSKFLNFYNANYEIIIPNRFNDGYGLSMKFIDDLQNVNLLITIDNGSTAVEEIKQARLKNIDVLVIDHHHLNETIPNANFIMNPKLLNFPEIYDLCGTGVVFLFCVELQRYWKDNNIKKYDGMKQHLSLVALATVCDVVPLFGINRALTSAGLEIIKQKSQYWCELLLSNISYIDTETLGFQIGPYINAAGRFGDGQAAFDFLYSENRIQQIEILGKLVEYNEKRKKIESEILLNINSIIDNNNDDVFIHYSEDWPEGLLGILAARIKDITNKPTILFTRVKKNQYKASGRSFEYFHLGRCIDAAKHLIITGGGHCMAGGLTINMENKEKFKEFVQIYYKNNINYEMIQKENKFITFLGIECVSSGLAFTEIQKFEPFGPNINKPIFCFPNVKIEFIMYIKNQHALFSIKNTYINQSTTSIIFNIIRTKFHVLIQNKITNAHIIGSVSKYNDKYSISIVDIILI